MSWWPFNKKKERRPKHIPYTINFDEDDMFDAPPQFQPPPPPQLPRQIIQAPPPAPLRRLPPGLQNAPPRPPLPPINNTIRRIPGIGRDPIQISPLLQIPRMNKRIEHTVRISKFNGSQIQNAAQNLINTFVEVIDGLDETEKAKAYENARNLIGIFDTHVRNYLCLWKKISDGEIKTISKKELFKYKNNIIIIFETILNDPTIQQYDHFVKVYRFVIQDLEAKIEGFKKLNTSNIELGKVCREADEFDQF